MAAKHSASPTSYRAFFHGLGQTSPIADGSANGDNAPQSGLETGGAKGIVTGKSARGEVHEWLNADCVATPARSR